MNFTRQKLTGLKRIISTKQTTVSESVRLSKQNIIHNENIIRYNSEIDKLKRKISLSQSTYNKQIYKRNISEFNFKIRGLKAVIKENNKIINKNKTKLDNIKKAENQINDYNVELVKLEIEKEIIKLRNMADEIEIDFHKQNKKGLLDKLQFKDAIKILLLLIDKYLYDSKIVLFIGDTYYALNENNRNKLINMIDNDLIRQAEMNTSDGRTFVLLKQASSITLIKVKDKHKYEFAGGKFFKYTHNLDLDLTLYGIYKNEDAQHIEYIDSCFINSLKVGGMCERKLNNIRLMCKNADVPMSKINEICEKIDIKVILKRPEDKGHVKPVYGNGDELYNIGLIDGHYFLINDTNITKYALTNYNTLKDIKNFNHIVNSKNKKDKRYVMNSYDLILNLFENKEKYLTKLTAENSNTAMSQYYKHIEDDIKSLEFNESNLKKVESKEPKERTEYINIFADFETETYNDDKQHTPYLCCYVSQDGRTGSFYGKQCGLEMMRDLEKHYKNIRVIAHNASYDYRFLANTLFIKNEINKG